MVREEREAVVRYLGPRLVDVAPAAASKTFRTQTDKRWPATSAAFSTIRLSCLSRRMLITDSLAWDFGNFGLPAFFGFLAIPSF